MKSKCQGETLFSAGNYPRFSFLCFLLHLVAVSVILALAGAGDEFLGGSIFSIILFYRFLGWIYYLNSLTYDSFIVYMMEFSVFHSFLRFECPYLDNHSLSGRLGLWTFNLSNAHVKIWVWIHSLVTKTHTWLNVGWVGRWTLASSPLLHSEPRNPNWNSAISALCPETPTDAWMGRDLALCSQTLPYFGLFSKYRVTVWGQIILWESVYQKLQTVLEKITSLVLSLYPLYDFPWVFPGMHKYFNFISCFMEMGFLHEPYFPFGYIQRILTTS